MSSLSNGHSSLKDDGTFARDDNFDKRDNRQGKPLSWDEIKKRLKDERKEE